MELLIPGKIKAIFHIDINEYFGKNGSGLASLFFCVIEIIAEQLVKILNFVRRQ